MPEFSEPELEQLTHRAKQQLRKQMRAVRSAHPASARSVRNAQIVEQLCNLPVYQDARSIALFYPMVERGEIDLRDVDRHARAAGKRVLYPFLRAAGEGRLLTGFSEVERLEQLQPSAQGFLQPPTSVPNAERGEVDLVVVPALAVALTGHRLGYGRGYYDATLPDLCPPALAVAVAFDFQLLSEIPVRQGDVPCDLILTDRGVHQRHSD